MDIIFTRCKPAGSRRLTFKEFLEAFGMVCEEAGMDFSEMASTMTRTATAPGTPSGARGSGGFDHPAMFDQEPVQLVQLPPSAARRGSLTDNKVGPYLPHMSASVGTGGSGSILSKLRFTPPRGVERPASPTFVHRAASPTASAARRNSNPASSSPPGDGGSMGRRELSSKEAVRASYPPTSDRSNPLFEVDSGSAGEGAGGHAWVWGRVASICMISCSNLTSTTKPLQQNVASPFLWSVSLYHTASAR